MQIKLFTIPIGSDERLIEEMNYFLRTNKIVDVRKELAMLDGNGCWTFCVTYIQSSRPAETDNVKSVGNGKVDYKDILDAAVFEKFSIYRKIRKQIADNEAIPAFAVFTDAELAEMAKLNPITLTAMEKIPGIGKKKIEKYGNAFIPNESMKANETSGSLDGTNSQS